MIAKVGPYPALKVKLTSQGININAGQVVLYKNKHGKLPAKLADLGPPSETTTLMLKDPWFTDLSYTPKDDGTFELRSAGPDKIFNTEDDVAQIF